MPRTNKNETEVETTTEVTILTPYGAHKLVNAAFAEAGLKAVPPQMLYNYTTGQLRKGKKPMIAYTPETGVDREDLQRWVDAYIAKKVAAATKVEAELAGDTEAESETVDA